MERGCDVQILLVRAVEETDESPGIVSPEHAAAARDRAGELDDEGAWLCRRARALLAEPLRDHEPLLTLVRVLAPSPLAFAVVALAAGLMSNLLGGRQIHAVFNPATVLVAWNVGVYLLLLAPVGGLRSRALPALPGRPASKGAATKPLETSRASRRRSGHAALLGRASAWLVRGAVVRLWIRLQRDAEDTRRELARKRRVGLAFAGLWTRHASSRFIADVRRALHAAAITFAVGAVGGMYLRGVGFDYNVVWESTFIEDPETIRRILAVAFAPANLLLGSSIDASDARALLGPAGDPAAAWIHRYAVTALLFVVLPRLALYAVTTFRAAQRRSGDLDLSEPYYERLLERARRDDIESLKARLHEDVAAEVDALSDDVADFVVQRLYDERIAPRVRRFRGEGGSVSQLEEDLRAAADDFRERIGERLREAESRLREGLRGRIGSTLARAGWTSQDLVLSRRFQEPSAERELGMPAQAFSRQVARAVSTGVGGAMAAVAGALAGGFGESLGIAIAVALFGTSGPIGFLIGAIVAAVAAVTAYWRGRDRVEALVKRTPLPGWLVRRALSKERMEKLLREGREQCRETVRSQLTGQLDPLVDDIAGRIWEELRAQPRPGAPHPP